MTVQELTNLLNKYYKPTDVLVFNYTDKTTAEFLLDRKLTDDTWKALVEEYDSADEDGQDMAQTLQWFLDEVEDNNESEDN